MKHVARLILLFLLCSIAAPALADIDIHFLDVGDADAAIVVCDGEVLVIDAGETEHSQFIHSYLRKTLNVDSVKCVVITHPHDDHIGGIPAVLSACKVDMLLSPVVYYPGTPFETVVRLAEEQQLQITVAGCGDEFQIGSAKCRVVSPIRTSTNINDLSIVILIEYGNTRFLFTGDMERTAEEILVNSWEDIQADVLKVAHHGRDTSSMHTFLRIVNADYYVVSGGEKLARSVFDRLNASNGTVFTTQEKGTTICHSDGNTISFTFTKTSTKTNWAGNEDNAELYFVGNSKSKKYHCSWCNSVAAMSEKNKVIFETKQEAIDHGYVGCANCRP